MSGGTHIITRTGDRIEIQCQTCKTSMDVSATSTLGEAMLENWPKFHKCPKPAKR